MRRILLSVLLMLGLGAGMLWAGNAGWGPVVVTQEHEFKMLLLLSDPWRIIDKPGITLRMPGLERVRTFDRRLQYLNVEALEMIIAEGERQIVDYYTVWRINDPLVYMSRFPLGKAQAEAVIQSKLKGIVGAKVAEQSLSQLLQRVELLSSLDEDISRELEGTGLSVVDVRINRTELPTRATPAAFSQMREERRALSREYRALGERDARQIRAEAEREARTTLALARADSQRTRGEGDAQSTATYAAAFGKDPEFYAFVRSLQAYRATVGANTTLVVPPTHEFFRYLDPNRRRNPDAGSGSAAP